MSDSFAELIVRSLDFFVQLHANNTREWFEPRKEYYTNEIKKPAELLGEVVRDELTRLTGEQMQFKLFRIHRDVRFSKDKTPYNAHLHLAWSPPQDGAPAIFFGASPENLTVGTGLMQLKGDRLTQFREMVDQRGDDLKAAMDSARRSVGATLSDWGPEPLKRVPKPFDPDHPHAALLKLKALAVSSHLSVNWKTDGMVPVIITNVKGMLPIWEVLDQTFG